MKKPNNPISGITYQVIIILIIFFAWIIIPTQAVGSTCVGTGCSDNAKEAINQYIAAGNFFNKGDYEKALAAYMTASQLGYEKCSSDKKIIEINFKLGRDTQALTASRNAFSSCGSNDKVVWNYYGDALYRFNNYPEALDAYNKALELDPYYTSAKNGRDATLSKISPEIIQPTVPKTQKISQNPTQVISIKPIQVISTVPTPTKVMASDTFNLQTSFLFACVIALTFIVAWVVWIRRIGQGSQSSGSSNVVYLPPVVGPSGSATTKTPVQSTFPSPVATNPQSGGHPGTSKPPVSGPHPISPVIQKIKTNYSIEDWIKELNSPDGKEREVAFQKILEIVRLKGLVPIRFLINEMGKGSLSTQNNIEQILIKIDSPAVEVLINEFQRKSQNDDIRWIIFKILSFSQDPKVIPIVKNALNDPDDITRFWAIRRLENISFGNPTKS